MMLKEKREKRGEKKLERRKKEDETSYLLTIC